MKRNKLMEECRQLVSPEIKREIDLSFEIADIIYTILQQKGITQREFAKSLNKKESEISKWLTGAHNFTTQTIARIEIALGESILEVTGKQKQVEKEFIYFHLPVHDYFKFSTAKEKPSVNPFDSNWIPFNNNEIANC